MNQTQEGESEREPGREERRMVRRGQASVHRHRQRIGSERIPIELNVVDPENNEVIYAFTMDTEHLPAGTHIRVEVPQRFPLPDPAQVVVDPNNLITELNEQYNISVCGTR